jgi:Protein of unknown function (DUF1064)
MSKYKATRTEYRGTIYDSKLEAEVAKTLDLLCASDDPYARVLSWDEQVKFCLLPSAPGQRAINYKADFLVNFGPFENPRKIIIEVKGYETQVWRMKEKMFRSLYPKLDLRVVRCTAAVVAIAQEKSNA